MYTEGRSVCNSKMISNYDPSQGLTTSSPVVYCVKFFHYVVKLLSWCGIFVTLHKLQPSSWWRDSKTTTGIDECSQLHAWFESSVHTNP